METTTVDPFSKKHLLQRSNDLKSVRMSTWDASLKERAEFILPRRARFFTTETNKGARKDQSIINSKPAVVSRTLRALLLSGVSSPSRRWFVGTISNPELRELASVVDWSFLVEDCIRETLKKSNIYQCLAAVFGDVPTFGTAALHVEEDLEDDIRGYVLPIGSYTLDNSDRLDVDTCFHEERLTVKKLAEKFGLENCSKPIRDAHAAGRLGQEFDVVHAIFPNPNYEPGKLGHQGMEIASRWFEATSSAGEEDKFLHEGGYAEKCLFAVRWATTGVDVYGSDCPGEQAIGDAKILQKLERRQAQAFEKVTNPPMVASPDVGDVDLTPGGITINPNGTVKVEPVVNIRADTLREFAAKIQELERRLESAYYADLALMLQRIEGGKMTATEVNARQQEQMLLLGEVMERFEKELLRPLLHRVFMILYRNGKLPPIPQELVGQELKWDFVSIMSQAQKLLATANIERFLSLVGNLKAVFPDVTDKVDADQAVDEYGSAVAVPPSIVRSDDEVAKIRAGRAAQAAKMQAQQDLAAQVQGAQVLSQTDTGGDNALTRLMGNTTGVPAPGSIH